MMQEIALERHFRLCLEADFNELRNTCLKMTSSIEQLEYENETLKSDLQSAKFRENQREQTVQELREWELSLSGESGAIKQRAYAQEQAMKRAFEIFRRLRTLSEKRV
eukprot:Filipodium_phascolosomae@DN6230_c0_g1_i1.p1